MTKIKSRSKKDFEKDLFKLMNNAVFRKTTQNVRKQIYQAYNTKQKKNLFSVRISENLLAVEINKIKVKMNRSVSLGLSILEISKTLVYEFWYDYI